MIDSGFRSISRFWLVLAFAFLVPASAQQQTQEGAPRADDFFIDGIVVDPMGGGIGDAKVRIEKTDASAEDSPLAEGVTDHRGRIEIRMARPALDEVRYRVAADGFAESLGTLDISDVDEVPFIDVTMKGAARISGTVTAVGTNESIVGAQIRCHNGGRRLTAETGPDGKYELDSVYFGPAVITVTAHGRATQREQVIVDEEDLPLDFELKLERPVELTIVTNTGEPAPEVTVETVTEPDQTRLATRTSDPEGMVRIEGVGPESTGLNLRLNGRSYLVMRGYEEFLELPAAGRPDASPTTRPAAVKARLTVTVAAEVQGRVVDKKTGRPVPNVRVLAGREPRYDMPMDWTGPGGVYELTGVRPGVVTVTFQHEDYATAFHSVDLHTGKPGNLDVQLERGVSLGGVVLDDQDIPVDQVRVAADSYKDYETLGLRAVTDTDGRFQFAHVPPGDIEFTFVRPGYGKPKTIVLASGRTDHRVVLEGSALPLTSGAAPIEETKLKPGQEVPDLKLTALDGTTYELSELRGKYIFLDCWATWCRPCMAEAPNVKALHEAMKDRGDFVLIGISLDTDGKSLKKVIEEEGITWPQIFGPKSGAGEAFEELDGVGIPYTCLIGPDGKLIAQHLRGPDLKAEVSKLIGSN